MTYGQAGKITEWWTQIKEDLCEEAGRAYTGVQRKMEQLVKDRKKELNKELSRALSGVAVRDDEWARTLDDWLEIYEHDEGELLRKKQKLHTAQKNKKDDRQYRVNMAYRMGLKNKDELDTHELSSTSSDTGSSDMEAVQETKPKTGQITQKQQHKLRLHPTRSASESLLSGAEKSSSPVPSHERLPKRMRKRTVSPERKKKIVRPNANFPDDLHALTTNISRLVEQRLVPAPILQPSTVNNLSSSAVWDKSPLHSSLPTLRGNDTYLMQQNEQLLETVQKLSQNMQSLMERTDECEQHISELVRVSHEKWAKVVLECSLVRTELQKVFRKLNEEDILLSPNDNEITPFGHEEVVAEAQAQIQASDGVVDNRMERYESLEQS